MWRRLAEAAPGPVQRNRANVQPSPIKETCLLSLAQVSDRSVCVKAHVGVGVGIGIGVETAGLFDPDTDTDPDADFSFQPHGVTHFGKAR
jgi:hypothetical protein